MTSHNSESEALAPCPFCTAAPKYGYHGDDDGGYHYVECRACCRPDGLEAERFVGVHAETRLDAIAAWNRRAAPKAPAVSETLTDAEDAARYRWLMRHFVRVKAHWQKSPNVIDRLQLWIDVRYPPCESITDSLSRDIDAARKASGEPTPGVTIEEMKR